MYKKTNKTKEKQLQIKEKLAKKIYFYLLKSNYNSYKNTLRAKVLAKEFNLNLRNTRDIIRFINIDEQFRRLIISTNSGYYMAKENDIENSLYHIVYLKRMAIELLKRTEKMVEKLSIGVSINEIPLSREEVYKLLEKKRKIILKNKVVIKLWN